MKSSNQVREFLISEKGIEVVELMIGPEGVLVGSARKAYELDRAKEEISKKHAIARQNKEIERRKNILDNEIQRLTSQFEMDKDELKRKEIDEDTIEEIIEKNRKEMMSGRKKR